MKSKIHNSILNQPDYWVEGVNGILYEAVTEYMEKNMLNRTQMAEHLSISKGRLSQILNDGAINFSIEKIIEIALKVGKYPVFKLENMEYYHGSKRAEDTIQPSDATDLILSNPEYARVLMERIENYNTKKKE